MPIVQQTVEVFPQANGGSNVIVRLYDQDATEYTTTFNAPAGFDVNSKVSLMITEQNEQLALNEFQALVGL
jgi:hypothetical protein